MKINLYKHVIITTLLSASTCANLFAQTADGAAPVAIAKEQIAKANNLAPTPPMGWNTWNTFQTKIDEPLLKGMVDAYVSSGMRDAGYRYFVLDDGWMSMERDKNGDLVADPKKFPKGMKAFADYVHAKGLKFGIYNCAGSKTCAGYPGSRGHEYQDARLYASFGVDFLKYDWCNTDSLNAREAYITMSQALKASGRQIVFSLCEWGNHQPWLWAGGVGELYRNTGDITASFDKNKNYGSWSALSVMSILDKQVNIGKYNGPNHWNDPDMLEVGNGMSFNEDKAHFSLWCMLSAPLAAGNDLRNMSPQTQSILTNKEAIAIDQDALGIAATRIYQADSLEVWAKPLANNQLAVCFLNRSTVAKDVAYKWQEHTINNEEGKLNADFAQAVYKLHDVWTKKDIGTTKKEFKQTLAGHSVVMLRLVKF
ncbi:glycoside hydrolase family 27 protein [Mucilaginibacter flavus]|uniref:glycoside hydrolase family 27 protein n=1 Tax=Mucilaginibacter flavus TaxID=931504 RepID=UPI0025B43724|nr:glycoside hydrolase family 27 protein [Mucilaginibacter flavus]MDN3580062.1 glycoside hydrolase family 27 protein [Mucilaginibacter flavus]